MGTLKTSCEAVRHIESLFKQVPSENIMTALFSPRVIGTIKPNRHNREESLLHRDALEDNVGRSLLSVYQSLEH